MIALLGAFQVTPEIEDAVLSELQRLVEAEMPTPTVARASIETRIKRLGRLYKDEVITDEEYATELTALRAQLAATTAPSSLDVDVQAAIGLLHQFSSFVTSSSVEGLQAMLCAVFSHVWAEGKQIAAVTPKGVYLPLLATLWKSSLGCPTGFEPATS
jgi:hypothetical protein